MARPRTVRRQGRAAAVDMRKAEALEVGPYVSLGVTGLEQSGGYVHEEFLPQLFGKRAINTFKEMRDNDATVGAMLFAIGMLIRQVEWRVEPASEDPRDIEVAEFVDSCFEDLSMTWDDTLSEILSMFWAGYAPLEEVYKIRRGRQKGSESSKHNDGRIGWRKLSLRAQETIERWIFSEDGQELQGLIQIARPDYVPRFIPVERFLLFRPMAHKENPEGRSMLRTAWRSWLFKKRFEEIEGIGIQRDLAGLPIAFVPPELLASDATEEQRSLRAQIEEVIRNVRRDEREGVVFPMVHDEQGHKLYDFQLLTSGGRRNFDTTAVIGRYNRLIAQTVLADFIFLGQDSSKGSFALADSKTQLFAVAMGAILDSITDVFNRFGIPRLLELNTFTYDETPTLVHGDIENIDIEKLGNYVAQLTGAGIDLTDEGTERFLRMSGGLPPRSEDEPDLDEDLDSQGGLPDGQESQQQAGTEPGQSASTGAPGSQGQPTGTIEGGP